MPGPRPPRLVGAVLRCYPRQWRLRRGAEAAELAVLLMRDGVPARSIAWSYLGGAARERLMAKPGHRLAAAAAALLAAAGALVIPLGLLSVPANAASAAHRHAAHEHAARPADPAARLAPQVSCGGHRLAPDVISIRVTPRRPAGQSTAGGHDQRC
jgi:hypothetical protein